MLELEAEPGSGEIGSKRSARRVGRPLEEHGFNANVVVEVFDMAKLGRDGTAGVDVEHRADEENGRPRDSHRVAALRNPVMPPQRVASA